MLSFFSSRRNWDSPNPSPEGECAPSLWFRGEGHTRWRERGWGSPNSDEGTHIVILFKYMYFVLRSLDLRNDCYKRKLERKAWTGCLVATLQPFLLVLPGAPDLESALHAGGRAPATLLLPLLALAQHLLRIKEEKKVINCYFSPERLHSPSYKSLDLRNPRVILV